MATNIVEKIYSAEDYFLFCEKISEYESCFEFSEGVIYAKHEALPIPSQIVELVLNTDIKDIHQIFNIPMATLKHSDLIYKISKFFFPHTDSKDFYLHTEGMEVLILLLQKYRKPDAVLVKRKSRKVNHKGQLLNPLVVIEILSKSTAGVDLGEKVAEYTSIDSLQDYLIFSQTEIWVKHYFRIDENTWNFVIYENIEESILLECLALQMPLKEIYEGIE